MKSGLESSGIPQEVLRAFNLGPGEIENAGKIYKIHSARGVFALKKVMADRAKLNFSASVIQHLRNNDFDSAVPYESTIHGEPWLIEQNSGYLLSPWIDGRQLDFTSGDDLARAVKLMAEFHQKGEGYIPSAGSWYRSRLGTWPVQWSKGLEEIRRCSFLTPFPDNLIKQGEQALKILNQGATYKTAVERAKDLGPLCHRDLVHHNFLLDKVDNLHIIDFEYCALELPVADLGRFLRKALPLQGWNGGVFQQLVSIYHTGYPLSCQDKVLLRAYLTFPHEWWRLANRLLQGTVLISEAAKRVKHLKDRDLGREELLRKLAAGLLE